jgi:hypothetical protein
MLGLRLLLVVDGLALIGASTISDPIVADVALLPALLLVVLGGIACLSGDLVPPRRRRAVVCSALSIAAPFPFLALPTPWGVRAGAAALIGLQVAGGWPWLGPRATWRAGGAAPRRIVAVLVFATSVMVLAVVGLVFYGERYLLRPSAGMFERGPFLTRLTTTEAQLAWRTRSHEPVQLVVRSPTGAAQRATRGTITGLRPGTRYVWTANVAGSSAAAGSFTTAPTTTADGITLVSFGDYGSGTTHEYAVGRLAAAAAPALFLSAGDNAYLLAAPPLLDRAIFDPLRPLLAEAMPVVALGEHDLAWDDGSAVISALHLPGHHYAVQYGPVQVVVLGLEADRSALPYARRTVGRCATPCPVRFVLTHRPIDGANPILPLLRDRGVSAILAAHLHRYERHVRGGVLQFTLGTGGEGAGGAQFTRATPDAVVSFLAYGFLQIRIQGTRVRYWFVDDQGSIRDRVVQPIPRAVVR